MKRILQVAFTLIALISNSMTYSQDTLKLLLRDIDTSSFAEVRFFLNVFDTKGKPITDLDSSAITINESESGYKVNPNTQNLYKSDEGIIICVAVDASLSMTGPPLDNVKAGLLSILNDLRPQDKMAITYFNNEFVKRTGFQKERDILKTAIEELETGGNITELYASAIESIKWIKSLPVGEYSKRRILILISDGDDYGNSKFTINDVIAEARNSNISIYTIGSASETTASKGTLLNMERIGLSTKDGKYYRMYKPEDLKTNIISVYDRIKEEYILKYFSYEDPGSNVKGTIAVKRGDLEILTDFDYTAPSTIIKNPPPRYKWLIYAISASGLVIIGLGVFLVININKKKRFKREKEEEQMLREKEALEAKELFAQFQQQYDELLDQLENQKTISEKDKDKIFKLENMMKESGKAAGIKPSIDIKRRTMILEAKTDVIHTEPGYPYLTVKNGPSAGQKITVKPSGLSIGRSDDNNLVIRDETISRLHAKITFGNGIYQIEDLGSANFTFVNGGKISKSPIQIGDIIKVGNIEISFDV